MSDELEGWSPAVKVVFSDQELVQHLRRTADAEAEPAENWWTFYTALPKPERDRLAAEAGVPPH